MSNILNWFSKTKLLVLSFVLGGLAIFLGFISSTKQCFLGYKQSIAYTLLIFVPVFLLAIFFYFSRESSFASWRKFLGWWIPISLILVILSPHSPADLSPIYKKTVVLFMGGGLVVVSLFLLIFKSLKKEQTVV